MEKKASKNIWLIIMGVLILTELVLLFCTLQSPYFLQILGAIVLVFVALYGCFLYKKPHGNMLKYTFLIFAAYTAIMAPIARNNIILYSMDILGALIVGYCAGRLNRIEKNKYYLIVADVLYIVSTIVTLVDNSINDFLLTFSYFSAPIILTTLLIAYFLRYKEHKEAGLADAPKA